MTRVEPLARRVRDRDEDDVRREPADRPADLVEAADDRDALDAAPAQPRVVVDEADDPLARRLAQLAEQAAAAAAGADDEVAALPPAADERREARARRRAPRSARRR